MGRKNATEVEAFTTLNMNQITQFYKSIKSIGMTDDDAKVVLNHILQETLEDWNKTNGEFIEIDGERVFAVDWTDIIATIMDCSYPELSKKYLNRSPLRTQPQPHNQ